MEIQHADETLRATTSSKLQAIVDQIRYLQEQALQTLEKTARDARLHKAQCNFVKKPGTTYHL